MAFVVWKTENGGRRVDGVYKTQAAANAAAAGNAALTAHTGSVNDNVEPGRYINSAGALLSTPPAAVLAANELTNWKARIVAGFIEGWEAEPDWRYELTGGADAKNAAFVYRYHQTALAYLIADQQVFTSMTRSNRNDTIEHIWKELRKPAFKRFNDTTKTIRDAWAGLSTDDGAAVNTDLVTARSGTVRAGEPDGTRIPVTGATIPAKFADTIQGTT